MKEATLRITQDTLVLLFHIHCFFFCCLLKQMEKICCGLCGSVECNLSVFTTFMFVRKEEKLENVKFQIWPVVFLCSVSLLDMILIKLTLNCNQLYFYRIQFKFYTVKKGIQAMKQRSGPSRHMTRLFVACTCSFYSFSTKECSENQKKNQYDPYSKYICLKSI